MPIRNNGACVKVDGPSMHHSPQRQHIANRTKCINTTQEARVQQTTHEDPDMHTHTKTNTKMSTARVPPPVSIPTSQHTVEISIIDTTSYMSGFPASTFVEPNVPGFDLMSAGSYGYIIKHPRSGSKYDTIIFDLGVRKDWEDLPETFVTAIKESSADIRVEKRRRHDPV